MSTRNPERFKEAIAAFNALRAVYAPHEAAAWLRAPHAMLDGRRPLDVIFEGEADRVMTVIALLVDGAFA